MALEKIIIVDRIEVTETSCLEVRTATRIMENGEMISGTFHRHVVAPGDDYSKEDPKVQAICKVTHTPAVIAAYKAQQEANKPNGA